MPDSKKINKISKETPKETADKKTQPPAPLPLIEHTIGGREFYSNTSVIRRLLEYCGVPTNVTKTFNLPQGTWPKDCNALTEMAKHKTCEYLVGWGEGMKNAGNGEFRSLPNHSLGWLLSSEYGRTDIFRSIWDKESNLCVIDVEYFSKKYPGETYINPIRVFWELEPTLQCMKSTFFSYGIRPLITATGQGYHIGFRVDKKKEGKDNPVYKELEKIGHIEDTLLGKYHHPPFGSRRSRPVTDEEGKVYDALGKLVEYVLHKTMKSVYAYGNRMPIVVGDAVVGNEKMEAISVDLSAFANPLYMRDIRMPFSKHHKHKMKKIFDDSIKNIPTAIAVPRFTPCNGNELTLDELFKNRRDYRHAANYASAINTEIPECSEGILKLTNEYKKSKLYEFHKDFDSTKEDDPNDWQNRYDKFELEKVPPCISHMLANPNPWLLQPTVIQTIVRAMTGKGWWHPKHIAGLFRSKYERDHKWEVNFYKYDANTWATVWTRIYAGMLIDGTDELVDFNCISHQEKGMGWDRPYCVTPHCGNSLGNYR